MFININEYRKLVKEKRETLEDQCNSATSPPEYKQYIANHRMYHTQLHDSIKKSIINAKRICAIATIGTWGLLVGCAYCGILPHTFVCLMWLPLFAILLYVCKIADKELAEFVCIYKKEV